MTGILRRLRGALGNALVWGLSWFGLGLAVGWAFQLLGLTPIPLGWTIALAMAASTGVTGFVTGAAFSVYLGVAHRSRTLGELQVGRIAAGGAVIAGLVHITLGAVAGWIVGIPYAPMALVTGGFWSALFGGITAGGTLAIAQGSPQSLSGSASAELEAEQAGVRALLEDGPR